MFIAIAAAALGLVVALLRGTFAVDREGILQGCLALLIGLLPGLLVLQPSASIDEGVVMHPTTIHDAFFYVSAAEWLRDHRLIDRPEIVDTITETSSAPAFAAALRAQDLSIRQGEHLIQAAAASFGQQRVSSQWYQLQVAWMMMVPGSVLALGRLIGLTRRTAWFGAIAMVSATLLSFQVLNQNSPSVLGLALLPIVVGLMVRALSPAETSWLLTALAAGAVGALVGVYSEMMILIAFLPLGVVLSNERGPLWGLMQGLRLLAFSILLSPYAWVSALRTLVRLAPSTPVLGPAMFWDDWLGVPINRFLGLASVHELRPVSLLTLTTGCVFAAGLLGSLRHRAVRWLTISVASVTGALWVHQGLQGGFYLVDRVAMIAQPVLFLVAAMGLGILHDGLRVTRVGARLIAPLLIAGGAVLIGSNLASTERLVSSMRGMERRAITREITEALGWVDDVSLGDGGNVVVVVDDYVERLWISDGLRDYPHVAYGLLTPDAFLLRSYADSQVDRYVLASPWVFTNLGDSSKLRENSRFVLYDTAQSEAVFVATREGFWGAEYAGSDLFEWMADNGEVVVIRNKPESSISLVTGANPALGTLSVVVTPGQGIEWGSFNASDSDPEVLSLPAQPVIEFTLVNQVPAVPLGSGDPRPVSLRIDDVGYSR